MRSRKRRKHGIELPHQCYDKVPSLDSIEELKPGDLGFRMENSGYSRPQQSYRKLMGDEICCNETQEHKMRRTTTLSLYNLYTITKRTRHRTSSSNRHLCKSNHSPPEVSLWNLFIALNIVITCLLVSEQSIKQVDCQRLFKQQQPAFPLPIPHHANIPLATASRSNLPEIITQQGGVIRGKNVTLTKHYNPIRITKDIVIRDDARLTIEAGTEILFDKRKGIIVQGTLEILGNSNDKVKLNLLKSQQSATINFRSQKNSPQQQVRLVDGDLPSEGRVQIKFNDRWHSLCTNSKNLTAADIKILCHQAGYQEGRWYKWFPRRNDTTFQIMSRSFHCSGSETSLQQCGRWNRVRVGGGVCDHQSDIGIQCSRSLVFSNLASPSYEYWRGIEFMNSQTMQEYIYEGQMKQKISRSRLSHVIISDSGVNEVGNATAAIRVHGQPPILNDIEIKNSIYGIMIEEADDAINLNNIRLTNNLGYPIFINTSWGRVSMDGMHIENNGGDGIRIVRHEKTIIGSHDFCKFANLGTAQSYPVILSHEQQFLTSGRDCCQNFISHNPLTVHFSMLRSTPNNLLPEGDANRRVSVPTGVNLGKDAYLTIFDDYRDEYPFRLRIHNNTRAQSIVSKSGQLRICYEPASYRTVLFTVEIVVSEEDDEVFTGRAHDVEISNSYIRRNEGRGIWIDNQRSGVKILNTTVIQHNYLSGIHVENGTGEVIIRDSIISNNSGHGLLIHLAGGYYHIDNSSITDNALRGISLDYDKRPELVPFNHTVHLGYSLIARNGENGLFIGNVCRSDAFWNISMNSFIKNGEDAIVFESCLPTRDISERFVNLTSRTNFIESPEMANRRNGFQELLITHNNFLSNIRRAINMASVQFVKSFIRHNLFKDHQLAVLMISNQHTPITSSHLVSTSPANIRIASNRFYNNKGRYVASLGLEEHNQRQSLVFTKNYLEGNMISEPHQDLKPRSRVSAVVVVSSSNVKVIRNRFDNPDSTYEMGAHLELHSRVINATANFWGHGLDAASIYRRIFDRKNRYNLAQVEFLQYLVSPEDLEYATDLSFERERDKITTFKNGTKLGGEIKGMEELPPDTYTVQDDIFIRPGGYLILKPGTVLKFQDGVGMMVQGRLDALGRSPSDILFTSALPQNRIPQRAPMTTTTTPLPYANSWVSHQLDKDYENELVYDPDNSTSSRKQTRITKRQAQHSSLTNVRLSHTTMGRLEVFIDGVWGSVCDYNFDINDAAVACQQLGMILNKDDWLLEKYQFAINDQQQIALMSSDALMTNLRCDPSLDTDLTACKAEIASRGDFDGTCNSEVGIRCFPPSWSGIRLGMASEISRLEHVTIQRAGMYDYARYSLKPALQIDLNRHILNNLVIKSNSDSGLGIIWNDVIGRHFNELSIVDSRFTNNERHGIELKSRGLTIRGCSMNNNRQNGLDYEPVFSEADLNDLFSWLYTPKTMDNIIDLTFPLKTKYFQVPPSEDSFQYFIMQRNPPPNITETFTIGTDSGHMLSIHLLSPIRRDSTESLNMSMGLNPESPIWDLRVNVTSFPMISPGYKFHFNYSSGSSPSGNIILYIRSRYNNRDLKVLSKFIPPHMVMPRFDQTATNINSKLINSIVITNCTIAKNDVGVKFRHPNHDYGYGGIHHKRYANETTNITNCLFDGNHFSPIFVTSDEFETGLDEATRMIGSTSDIRYHLINNKLRRNKDGIRQFSRDIRYSYNVFHWTINDTMFESNRGGGINIVLPYFWRYDSNLSNVVEISNNSFLKNTYFDLSIEGHFTKLSMNNNILKENRCRSKLISISGMEKSMLFRSNTIEANVCNRIIDLDIQSHADKMGSVTAQFEFNAIRHNRRQISNVTLATLASNVRYNKLLSRLHPYAVGLRGVQSLNISRNLFVNPELRFELVVAIMMDLDERTVNAVENYWGTVMLSDINDRIFDFDDWNSYALAEKSPFLIRDSFTSSSMIAEPRMSLQANSIGSLGGRLMKSTFLPYRKDPYIIESDLTVMPNVRLTIEKGVILEFMPNVGILVLGDLIAAGTRDRPIQMRPLLGLSDVLPLRNYLLPLKTRPNVTVTSLTDPLSYEHNYAFKHFQFAYPVDLGSVRLCKNEICNDGSHIYENNVEEPNLRREVLQTSNSTWKMDGFLEIFNMTTLQWVPVCDPLFTEHTARVVCRQLGYSHFSLFRRGHRHTIEHEQINGIKYWPASVQCDGDESSLSSCPLAATGFMNHTTSCHKESNQFVYVYCRDYPDKPRTDEHYPHSVTGEHLYHWGGIRFSCPSSAIPMQNGSYFDANETFNGNNHLIWPTKSRLQYVTVDRAGMLHRNKAPAIQVLQCNVQIEYVSVTNSAHHGIEMITSHGRQNLHQLRVRNNLGIGINYLTLTGSSSATRLVPYLPLKHLDISSDIFGLVDICGANKEIRIDERLLIFYKYGSKPADCVKIISSKLQVKHLGIRMLQFNLMNSTTYTPKPDYVKIYDGNIFDRDSRLLVDLGVTDKHRIERPELKFYQSSDSTMTIRLHASGSSPFYGFIAEVVTTPVSYNIQRDTYNNITFSEIIENKLGGLTVVSAGESAPNLIIRSNRLESNCHHLFGNFTSCTSPIYMELQNCQRLRIGGNLIKENQGGITIKSYSHSAVSALDASIDTNVFEGNSNTNTLALLGPKTDPYQMVKVLRNIFTRNHAPYVSNIVLSRIVANFSGNIITGNTGKHQIEVVGFDKLPLSYQTFSHNWIYNNLATFERDRSTIFGNSAGQQYHSNYFVNPDNHFEISTMNWSRYDVRPLQVPRDDEIIHLASGDGSSKDVFRKTADAIPLNIIDMKKIDLYLATINAKNNWWGFNTTTAIQGRIRDRVQHEELIKVDFSPYLETNSSVLSGICAGGWQKVGNACLVYVGTRMTYQEALDFCDRERATLPLLRGNHYEFTDFVQSQDRDFDSKIDRIWIRSFDVSREACPAINDYRTKNYECQDKHAFLCEKDPQVVVSMVSLHRETGGLIALILTLITILLIFCCSICWGYKSKLRQRERLERKNSIYASMRSNRGGPYSSNNSLSEFFLHRQIYNPEKSSITDLSLSTQLTHPSNDESHLVRLNPTGGGSATSAKRQQLAGGNRSNRLNNSSDQLDRSHQERSQSRSSYGQQAAANQSYVSPSPLTNGVFPPDQATTRSITPAPSYKELHPSVAVKLRSSRTPSLNSSQFGDVSTDPMPTKTHSSKRSKFTRTPSASESLSQQAQYYASFPPPLTTNQHPDMSIYANQPILPPPPPLSYQYSNINLSKNLNQNGNQQVQGSQDGSGSSVPTYYSNQGDTFEESTDSYRETYNIYHNYNNTLQRMNNDQASYIMTERSSITDELVMDTTNHAQAIDDLGNLILSRPQGASDVNLNRYNQDAIYQHEFNASKAYSETGSQSYRYLMETSFDFDPINVPTIATTTIYNGSQRLSPAPSSLGPPDSKLGSRVYLETSFE